MASFQTCLNRSSKHQRIARVLAREIHSGALEPGSRLPGEHALTQRFAVSRTTVRQALDELSKQGLISTHAGVGSFVAFDGGLLDNSLGWTRALADQGARITTEVLRLEAVRDARLAGELGLDGDEWASVKPLAAEEATLLRRPEGEVWLNTRRVSRGADGRIVEHVASLLDPGRFQLHLGFGEQPQ